MARTVQTAFISALFVLAAAAVSAAGDDEPCTTTEGDQLISPFTAFQQYAGAHIAVSGGTLALGAAAGFDTDALDRVEIYTLESNQWVYLQAVMPDNPTIPKAFSSSISLDGDTLVVGARDDSTIDQHSGAAFVFVRSEGRWSLQQKLLASDGAIINDFGNAVDVDGDVLIVGAPFHNVSGAAYIFRFDGAQWVEEQELFLANGTPNDVFGDSVSIQDDVAVVCAREVVYRGGPWPVALIGSAYVYRYDGKVWNLEAHLTAPEENNPAEFGQCVDLDGDRIVVGAPAAAKDGEAPGAVFIFARSEQDWVLEGSVWGTPPINGFGWSVDLAGDQLLVSDLNDSTAGKYSGAAHLYTFDGGQWDKTASLYPSTGEPFMGFGNGVALGDSHAIVGAPGANAGGIHTSGAVYVYTLPACPDAPDTPADLNADGAVDGADLGLLLSAWGEGESSADLNGDTTVDGADLGLLLSNWTS